MRKITDTQHSSREIQSFINVQIESKIYEIGNVEVMIFASNFAFMIHARVSDMARRDRKAICIYIILYYILWCKYIFQLMEFDTFLPSYISKGKRTSKMRSSIRYRTPNPIFYRVIKGILFTRFRNIFCMKHIYDWYTKVNASFCYKGESFNLILRNINSYKES